MVHKNKVAIHLEQLNASKMPKARIIIHQMPSTKIELLTTLQIITT